MSCLHLGLLVPGEWFLHAQPAVEKSAASVSSAGVLCQLEPYMLSAIA
jgi:hypothetical protein